MERKDIEWRPKTFTSLYQSSKVTEILYNTLKNACECNNKVITRRKGEFAKYELDWHNVCRHCNPPEKVKEEVEGYVFPAWKWGEDGHIVFL